MKNLGKKMPKTPILTIEWNFERGLMGLMTPILRLGICYLFENHSKKMHKMLSIFVADR